jgi:hypothetical protein
MLRLASRGFLADLRASVAGPGQGPKGAATRAPAGRPKGDVSDDCESGDDD